MSFYDIRVDRLPKIINNKQIAVWLYRLDIAPDAIP